MGTEDKDNAFAAVRRDAEERTVAAHAAHVAMQMLAHLALHIVQWPRGVYGASWARFVRLGEI